MKSVRIQFNKTSEFFSSFFPLLGLKDLQSTNTGKYGAIKTPNSDILYAKISLQIKIRQ